MNLHGIVSVSGKTGLWRALTQSKTGFILESLDGQKLKLVVNLSTAKLAALEEITVFGEVEDLKLIDVLERMKNTGNIPDAKKADGKALRTFFREAAPGHDEEKVYASDIKKIIAWFEILKNRPEFNAEPEKAAVPAEQVETENQAE